MSRIGRLLLITVLAVAIAACGTRKDESAKAIASKDSIAAVNDSIAVLNDSIAAFKKKRAAQEAATKGSRSPASSAPESPAPGVEPPEGDVAYEPPVFKSMPLQAPSNNQVVKALRTVYEPFDYQARAIKQRRQLAGLLTLPPETLKRFANEASRRKIRLDTPYDSTGHSISLFKDYGDTTIRRMWKYLQYQTRTRDTSYFHALFDYRQDGWEVDSADILERGKYTALVVDPTSIDWVAGKVRVKLRAPRADYPLCSTEKFKGQLAAANSMGTAFAVSKDYVVTSLHGVITAPWVYIIYNFPTVYSGNNVLLDPSNVFIAKKCNIEGVYNGAFTQDFCVLKLERPVLQNRVVHLEPVGDVFNDRLYLIGNIEGLSQKYLLAGKITKDYDKYQYLSRMHSAPGCSGGPVFSETTHNVVALQMGREVKENYKLRLDRNKTPCWETIRCKDDDCSGTFLTKIEVVIQALNKACIEGY